MRTELTGQRQIGLSDVTQKELCSVEGGGLTTGEAIAWGLASGMTFFVPVPGITTAAFSLGWYLCE